MNEDDMDWEQIEHKFEDEKDSDSDDNMTEKMTSKSKLTSKQRRAKNRVKGADHLNIKGKVSEAKQKGQIDLAKRKQFFADL